VLGLKNTASVDEIKEAYRKLAKKYHPDVNTTGTIHEPNADKFRQIAEAYAVLSVPENKMSYDINYTKNEEAVFSSQKSSVMNNYREERDRRGLYNKDVPKKGSYADHRRKQIERERKKYNVNHLGYYKGGLPQKNKKNVRGNACNPPGDFHGIDYHNYHERADQRESHMVNALDAEQAAREFKLEANIRKRARPFYTLEFDYTWRYVRDRTVALWIILAMIGSQSLYSLFKREKMRANRTSRLPENLEKAPAHHFVNRGGVLMKKEFVGFAKYFQNDKELTAWYKKVYPTLFVDKQQS
jgi:curved DNA-binding protein CbpA